jgi:DNA polymerase elongation subunit (family B)
MNKPPRILLLDIETAPGLGWTFDGKYEANIIEFKEHSYMLSFAFQWLGQKRIRVETLADNGTEKLLINELWHLLDEADVVIGHNGDKFDIRKSNARLIKYGFKPPSPYKTIDTLKIARKHFGFASNRLDDLAQFFGIGRKLPHRGRDTWFGCMANDPIEWKTMRRYNAHDVYLLEQVYLRLRPWATTHPNLDSFAKAGNCPTCGKDSLQQRGWIVTKTGRRKRFHCQACGAWSSGTKLEKEKLAA